MGKVLAWLKAHWAPALGVGLAVVLALWFIVFRKSASSSGPVKTVTIPSAASSGGSTGGSDSGPLQSVQDAVASVAAVPASWFPSFTAWVNQANRPDLQGAPQAALTGEYVKELQSSGEGVLGFLNFDQWLNQANRPDLQGATSVNLWGEYVKEQLAALRGPAQTPAAPLGTPIAGGVVHRRPLANLGTGGLGSGNSPAIAPGGPLKQLIPMPQSFSWPAAPNKGPV